MKNMILVLASVLALAGCKTIDIQDGNIPDSFLAQAKQYEGTYHGNFNGVEGDITVSFDGNKPVVTYKNSQGTDILNNNCNSAIGNLNRVYLMGDKSDQLDAVSFVFSAGQCSLIVDGREIMIRLNNQGSKIFLNVDLEKGVENDRVCDWDVQAPTPLPAQPACRWVQNKTYLHGTFSH